MIDGLPVSIISSIDAPALILIFGWALTVERLYTRGQVTKMQAAHEREIKRVREDAATAIARAERSAEREIADANHERDEWRTEDRLNQQTISEINEQKTKMLVGFDALAAFLQSLRRGGGMDPAADADIGGRDD